MSPRIFAAIGTGLAATAMTASTTLAGPAVSTRWNNATMSQDECLLRAEDAIKAAGFGQIERTEQSRYGTLGDYTATIRCVTSKGIVFFISSGPSRSAVGTHTETLYDKF